MAASALSVPMPFPYPTIHSRESRLQHLSRTSLPISVSTMRSTLLVAALVGAACAHPGLLPTTTPALPLDARAPSTSPSASSNSSSSSTTVHPWSKTCIGFLDTWCMWRLDHAKFVTTTATNTTTITSTKIWVEVAQTTNPASTTKEYGQPPPLASNAQLFGHD